MGRDLDDPNELVEQRRRRRIGASQPSNLPVTEDVNTSTSQQSSNQDIQGAKKLVGQVADLPDTQQASELEFQESSNLTNQQDNEPAIQIVSNVTTLPANTPTGQQANMLDHQPSSKLNSEVSSTPDSQQVDTPNGQPASKSTRKKASKPASQQTSESKSRKDDREQQAVYLPSEQRQILKLLAVLENRELSDIAEDAFNLYIQQSPFKAAIPKLLEAQKHGKAK